ncbi:MAG: alpha-ketoglutarate-dependent dioxygenase AlkB [Nannocystaceae bacterium]
MKTEDVVGALYVREFVADHGVLLERLVGEVPWDTRMRARKTTSFGAPYNYSGMSYPEAPMRSDIAGIRDALVERVGFVANNCLVNFYADGHAKMGFHADSIRELVPGTGVAIVSLGCERTLYFRDIADKARKLARPLAGGSLLYMPPAIQGLWKHGVLPQPGVGPRISLTFRQLVTP